MKTIVRVAGVGLLAGVAACQSGGARSASPCASAPCAPPGFAAARLAPSYRRPSEPPSTESYAHLRENDFVRAADEPLSTFSVDVDTASYANVRRFLNAGELPPEGAVRIEEMLNYFPYDLPQPESAGPVGVRVDSASCPWAPSNRLVRVALKARDLPEGERPPMNLVFLCDVSGSMAPPNKLPLVKQSMRMLAGELGARDRVTIVVYAGSEGLVLPTTPGDRRREIVGAISRLDAGGSTNGGAGIRLAYEMAEKAFLQGGVNRVVLATDGDFNVGVTNESELVDLVQAKAKAGVFLTVLGFGMGNYKDSMLEALADKGNGNYGYVDGPREARKILVDQSTSTLVTVAKDVKIQVEFNPAKVEAYRLVGYEDRLLAKQDFNDDRKDAGEMGAGHAVTALYEVVPAGGRSATPPVDPLRYGTVAPGAPATPSVETLLVKVRWKAPQGDVSERLDVPFTDAGGSLEAAPEDLRFASAVALFGMLLRGSTHVGTADWGDARRIARGAVGRDPGGWRAEFVGLVGEAEALSRQTARR